MNTLKSEISRVEIYSIDETFLDFLIFVALIELCQLAKVKKWTGIPFYWNSY